MPQFDPELKDELCKKTLSWGADLVGVAALSPAAEYVQKLGFSLSDYPRAVAFGVFFPKAVINELRHGPTHTYLHFYRVVNARVDDIGLSLNGFLEKRGYRTFPVPSSQRVSRDRLAGVFPHRLAAGLAGLGWVGKSGSLITPEVGPRLRLGTVLTDAPLLPDQPVPSRCGDCTLCRDACPAKAIKGIPFRPEDSLELRLAPDLCDQYLNQVRSSFGKRVCGHCLAVCPWGST
jgi:epoxyqueuosine reductase